MASDRRNGIPAEFKNIVMVQHAMPTSLQHHLEYMQASIHAYSYAVWIPVYVRNVTRVT